MCICVWCVTNVSIHEFIHLVSHSFQATVAFTVLKILCFWFPRKMCATMTWPLHNAAVRFLHKGSVSEMKKKNNGVWKTLTNTSLITQIKKTGARRFPPYGSCRLLDRYQCIKTYPGLYFATLGAEKQTIPPRSPHCYSWITSSCISASSLTHSHQGQMQKCRTWTPFWSFCSSLRTSLYTFQSRILHVDPGFHLLCPC